MKTLIIYGPTATGKTDLAITLAKKYGGEIISADSRQVYRDLDIATGKVSFGAKVAKHTGYWIVDGIRINGFDIRDPGQQFTAAEFLKFVHTSMIRITVAGKLPIVVGGTGFYIKALIEPIDSIGIPANPKLRGNLQKLSVQELSQKLSAINPQKAKSMNRSDRKNPRRLIRAIEIAIYNRKPAARLPDYKTTKHLIIGLTAPNPYLYERADKWLKTRLERGLMDEVKEFMARGADPSWLDALGLESRWLTRYLSGRISSDVAIERLKGDIHNFIRRQKTWFKQFKGIKLFDISQNDWRRRLEKTIEAWYTLEND